MFIIPTEVDNARVWENLKVGWGWCWEEEEEEGGGSSRIGRRDRPRAHQPTSILQENELYLLQRYRESKDSVLKAVWSTIKSV